MELRVERKWKKSNYTIGNLYVNNVWFCNTLEDTDRNLKKSMGLEEIKSKKVYGKTAIPIGTYSINMNTISPKFSKKQFYISNANKGRVPRLENVKGFDGILIHCGNYASESYGCLLVGLNKIKGGVTQSKETFKKLYHILQDAYNKGEKITIKIE